MTITDSLAQYLNTEDEFAAVISHEMGHYLAYHHEEDMQNRMAGALVAGVIFGA